MRAVNTFCIIVLAFALVAAAVHVTVEKAIKKAGGLNLPLGGIAPPLCLPPPDNVVKLAGNELWIAAARKAAHEIATIKGEVTVDDVWQACPPPEGMNRKLMMAAFPRSEWEVVDYVQSQRQDVNHGRRIAVWRRKGDA